MNQPITGEPKYRNDPMESSYYTTDPAKILNYLLDNSDSEELPLRLSIPVDDYPGVCAKVTSSGVAIPLAMKEGKLVMELSDVPGADGSSPIIVDRAKFLNPELAVGYYEVFSRMRDGISVIDVGGGHKPWPGAWMNLEKELGASNDRSPHAYIGQNNLVPILMTDGCDLPIKTDGVGIVNISHVLEHLPPAASQEMLDEAMRVSKHGVLIEVPTIAYELVYGYPFHRLVAESINGIIQLRPKSVKEHLHLIIKSVESYHERFESPSKNPRRESLIKNYGTYYKNVFIPKTANPDDYINISNTDVPDEEDIRELQKIYLALLKN